MITPMTCPIGFPRPQGGRHLIIPYTLDCNDMRFATPQGFNSGDQFSAISRILSTISMKRGGGAHQR